jgi:hypothetical protein
MYRSPMQMTQPGFTGEDWLQFTQGLSYESDPPENLDSDENLRHKNEWMRLLCVFEQAKKGIFRNAPLLLDLVSQSQDDRFREVGIQLLAYVVPKPTCLEITRFYSHPDFDLRLDAYAASLFMCDLRLVDPLLYVRRNSSGREKDIIMSKLSALLEPEPDSILDDTDLLSNNAYEALVHDTMHRIQERFGSNSAILNGEVLSLEHIIRKIESLCRDPNVLELGGIISRYFDFFEVMTGIPSIGLFDDEVTPRPLSILAVLEEFRESEGLRSFIPGHRYFFGHRVPDQG